jgi:hypothetical protein
MDTNLIHQVRLRRKQKAQKNACDCRNPPDENGAPMFTPYLFTVLEALRWRVLASLGNERAVDTQVLE